MKKVLKQFNRVLSVALAVAMVITMIPQTSMIARAAEAESTSIETEAAESSEAVSTNEDGAGEEAAPEDDGDLDEEAGPQEDVSDGEEDQGEEIPSEEASSEETDAPEETAVPAEEEESASAEETGDADLEIGVQENEPTIDWTVKVKDSEADPDKSHAAVTFEEGVEGEAITAATVKFTVVPDAGYSIGSVEYKIGDDGNDMPATEAEDGTNAYEITAGDGKEAFEGNVLITITLEEISYKVTFSVDTGVKVTMGEEEEISNNAVKTVKYDDSIKFAVEENTGYKLLYVGTNEDGKTDPLQEEDDGSYIYKPSGDATIYIKARALIQYKATVTADERVTIHTISVEDDGKESIKDYEENAGIVVEENSAESIKFAVEMKETAAEFMVDGVTVMAGDAKVDVSKADPFVDSTDAENPKTYENVYEISLADIPEGQNEVVVTVETALDPDKANKLTLKVTGEEVEVDLTVDGDAYNEPQEDGSWLVQGEEVNVTLAVNPDDAKSYAITGVKVNGEEAEPTAENGSTYKVAFADKKGEIEVTVGVKESEEATSVIFGKISEHMKDFTVPEQKGVALDEDAEGLEEGESKYTVDQGTGNVTFEVTVVGNYEPVVMLDEKEEIIGKASPAAAQAGGKETKYVYAVPANKLKSTKDGGESSKITFEDIEIIKTVSILYNADEVEVTVSGTEEESAPVEGGISYEVPVDTELTIEMKALENCEITKVTKTVGEEETDETAKAVKDGKISVTAADEAVVEIASRSEYVFKLSKGADEVKAEKGIYTVDYAGTYQVSGVKGTKPVTFSKIEVLKGEEAAKSTAANDGTITMSADDADQTLTVKLYEQGVKDDNTQGDVEIGTMTLKVLKKSAKVTIKDGNKAVSGKAVSVTTDTVKELTVVLEKGASAGNLEAEIVEAEAAEGKVSVVFEDGKLLVTVAPLDKKIDDPFTVRLFDKADAEKKAVTGGEVKISVGDPVVVGKKPGVTLASATDKAIRLNLTKDKAIVKDNVKVGTVFYKIEVKEKGAETKLLKTEYVDAFEYEDAGKPVEITVVEEAGEAAKRDLEVTVTLLQTKKADVTKETIAAEEQAGNTISGGNAVLNTATKEPYYETKLSFKKATTTIYTGQKDVIIGTPVYSKNTTYDSVGVQFVDAKTGVVYNDEPKGSVSYGIGKYTYSAEVDAAGNIKVGIECPKDVISYLPKDAGIDLAVKVTADAPEGNVQPASTIVKLTIVRGIEKIEGTVPESLFKDAGKPASFKITPVFNEGEKGYAPKAKKVEYSITDIAGNTAGLPTEISKVSVKANGTVTVAKDFKVNENDPEQNRFYVTVKATDFAENETKAILGPVTVSDMKQEPKLLLVDGNGKAVENTTALTSEQFSAGNKLYVIALSKDAEADKNYTLADCLPVTFQSSNAKAIGVEAVPGTEGRKAQLILNKPAKGVKITATATDGSKNKAEMKFDVAAYKNIGLEIVEGETGAIYMPDEHDITYSGNTNAVYSLYYMAASESGWAHSEYSNYSLSVKGGKIIQKAAPYYANQSFLGYQTVIVVNSAKATITLKDNFSKTTELYTIENTGFSSLKAPKITTKDKMTVDTKAITYQVTDAANGNYAGKYVQITPDWTDTKNSGNTSYCWLGGQTQMLRIDDSGKFTLEAKNTVYAGLTYKLIATVGDRENGEFVPAAKDVKLTIKIPASKKANMNLSVTGSYKISAKANASAKIDVKTDAYYVVSDAKDEILKDQKQNVHVNHFTKYFAVTGWYDNYRIGLKSDLSDEDLAYITDMKNKEAAKDRVGYITVTNGNYRNGQLVNPMNTKDVKVTISFNDAKLTSPGATVYLGTNGNATTATVEVQNGKNNPVGIAYAKVVADGKDGGFTADVRNGKLVLSSKTAEAKAYTVKVDVVPSDSAYVNAITKDDEGVPQIQNKTLPVTVKIVVKDKADATGKIKVTNANVKLTADNYVNGSYVAEVPYSVTIADTAIASKTEQLDPLAVDEKFKGFITAEAGTNENGNFIRLSVSKKGLAAEIEAAKAAGRKSVVSYGKAATVPVTVTCDGCVKTETLNFKITMPAEAPTFEQIVENLEKPETKEAIEALLPEIGTESYILDNMKGRVKDKVAGYVAKDSDIAVGEPVGEITGEKGERKITIKVTLTNSAAAEGDSAENKSWEGSYEFALLEKNVKSEVSAIAAKLSAENLVWNVTNKTTRAEFLKMIKETAGAGSNITFAIRRFTKVESTDEAAGKITVTVYVSEINGQNSEEVVIEAEIGQTGLVGAEKAIEDALTQEALDEIIAINNAVEDLVKNAVLDTAKAAVAAAEEGIAVDFAEGTTDEPAWAFEKPASAEADGKLSYTLKLTKGTGEGAEDTEFAGEGKIDKAVFNWKDLAGVEADVKAKVADADDYSSLGNIIDGSNDGVAVREKILNAAKAALTNPKAMTVAYKVEDEAEAFSFEPATGETDGVLSFKLVITFGAKDEDAEISVESANVPKKDAKYQTAKELLKAITEKSDLAVEFTAGEDATDDDIVDAIIEAVTEEVEKLKTNAALTVTIEKIEEGEGKTVYTAPKEEAPGTITNLKVTVKEGESEGETGTIASVNVTQKAETQP